MSKLSAADLLKQIGSDNPPSLCMICGEDSLTVSQTEKRIRKKLTDGDALSDTVFDGQAPDIERLSDACGFSSMFQPVNLIIIRDLDPDSVSAADIDRILSILGNLAPRTVVLAVMTSVAVYEIRRNEPSILPKFKKIAGFFDKNGVLCICEKKNAIMLGKQIIERAKRHGSDISRHDAEELAGRCLCDSTLIRSELDKLLACADGTPITHDMLDALVAALPDADAFRLARAVTSGNGKAAFRLLEQLTARSEDTKTILGLLSILSGTFTDLYRAKLGQGAARQQQEIAADFGYPKNREFAVKNAMRDCGAMSLPQLRTCIRILRQTDKSCKSSPTPPRLLLEQAIVRMLCVRRDGTEVTE